MAVNLDSQADAPLVLESLLFRRLGVRHGFSTRLGGVSEGPFSTLNLAVGPGDRREAVAENMRRFCAACGLDPASLFQTSQVHGVEVREIVEGDDPSRVVHEEADALVCRVPTFAIGVRVADCVPVLVIDEESRHAAAIHAGWRGVVGGVIASGISQLARFGSPRTLAAAIGPSIGPCCFEVGEEVADLISGSVGGDARVVVRGPEGRPRVDLRRAVRLQLEALGIDASRIDDSIPLDGACTRCDGDRFFSFRRDGARSGRHLAAICGLASPSP